MTQIPSSSFNDLKPNLGKRIIAGLVDYTLIWCFLIIIAYTIGEPNEEGGQSLNGVKALIPIAFWAFMTIGLEQWIGKTFGNLLVDLKPVPISGKDTKLTLGQSIKRHLFDPIDMFLFGLVGIVTISNTEKHQRLGDIWAKTVVVKSVDP